LGKSTKTDATRAALFTPDLTGGTYSALPNPLAVFSGPNSKGSERTGVRALP